VSIIDADTGIKIRDINLNGGGGVELIFNEDGTRVYVSQMETASVFEIDTVTKEILRVFATGGSWTKEMTISPDGSKLYASNWVSHDVSEIDLVSGKLIRRIKTVRTPRGLYISPDGRYLYVAGFQDGEIQKINLATDERAILIKTGGAMRHFVGDAGRGIFFASDMGRRRIYKVDIASDAVTEFALSDTNPNTIVLSPDKKILIVSCRGINYSATDYSRPGTEWGTVLLFDSHSGKLLDAIIGGNQPTALAVSPDGSKIAFSDFLDSKIEFYSVPAYSVLASDVSRPWLTAYKSYIRK